MQDGSLLDAREEQAYRLLVGLSAARPTELAEVAELTQHEADEVLQRLQAKGLVAVQQADEPVFRALPPDVALGTTLLRRQESLEAARKTVAALSEEFRASASRRDAHHLVEVIVGATTLRERLRDLQEAPRGDPLVLPGQPAGDAGRRQHRGVRRAVPRRLVSRDLRAGTPRDPRRTRHDRRGRQLGRGGPHPADAPGPAGDRGPLDRGLSARPRQRNEHRRTDGRGDPPRPTPGRTARALREPLGAGDAGAIAGRTTAGGEGLDDSERFLLSLLVAGVPDKSIASQLGISRPIVQRRLDRMMALAGVDTRTGLAFQAAKRSWI